MLLIKPTDIYLNGSLDLRVDSQTNMLFMYVAGLDDCEDILDAFEAFERMVQRNKISRVLIDFEGKISSASVNLPLFFRCLQPITAFFNIQKIALMGQNIEKHQNIAEKQLLEIISFFQTSHHALDWLLSD